MAQWSGWALTQETGLQGSCSGLFDINDGGVRHKLRVDGFDRAPAFKDPAVQTDLRCAHDHVGGGGVWKGSLLISASDVGAGPYFAVGVTSRKLLIFPESQVFHQ